MKRTRIVQLDTLTDGAIAVRRANRRGFTLLESLIAMVILAATVLAVGSAINASSQQSIEGQKQILAAMAADDLLAELSALPYADLINHHGLDPREPESRTFLYGQIETVLLGGEDDPESVIDTSKKGTVDWGG